MRERRIEQRCGLEPYRLNLEISTLNFQILRAFGAGDTESLCSVRSTNMKIVCSCPWLLAAWLIAASVLMVAAFEDDDQTQLYIVYMGDRSHMTVEETLAEQNRVMSSIFTTQERASKSTVYHYKYSFSGFSAMLDAFQAESISKLPGVVSVFKSELLEVQTTRSWTYLGLDPSAGVWPDSKFGEDVIIGIIDTGIWPESQSFNDTGLTPVPTRWKGTCTTDVLFNGTIHCNNKVIGAKYYINARNNFIDIVPFNETVRDEDGHGTHTASIAAGVRVDNVDYLGLANGTAVGGAPSAKLAIYKACWFFLCSDADILAAFDDAVKDGVDIVSVSLGSVHGVRPFLKNAIDIGGFHATAAGILVVQAAGNFDYSPGTVSSVAPWLLLVGASTMDREITSDIVLGDSTVVQGLVISPNSSIVETPEEIVRGLDARLPGVPVKLARSCKPRTLRAAAVAGKVVLCQLEVEAFIEVTMHFIKQEVSTVNGSGVVVVDNRFTIPTDGGYGSQLFDTEGNIVLGVGIDEIQASTVYNYMNSSKSIPTATIRQRKTTFLDHFSPSVASFSSSGPNRLSPYIFKPDLTAPGVSILAAWSEFSGSSGKAAPYRMWSGTSIACPHVAGAAALLKSLHPTWSPAAIKSALMTTATFLPNDMILSSGAGEINVVRAVDPGLVYNISTADYLAFLCAENYNSEQLFNLTGAATPCPTNPLKQWNLNYPIITAPADEEVTVVQRTVTNVGDGMSTYRVEVETPVDTMVTIQPAELAFKRVDEELHYNVTIEVINARLLPSFGVLRWTDGIHNVTSRIFITIQKPFFS